MAKKAILVVSFGTSVNATREKTIDRIEADIQKAMPDRAFYRAWTSGMIIRKIEKRDDVHINTVEEAMKQMLLDFAMLIFSVSWRIIIYEDFVHVL